MLEKPDGLGQWTDGGMMCDPARWQTGTLRKLLQKGGQVLYKSVNLLIDVGLVTQTGDGGMRSSKDNFVIVQVIFPVFDCYGGHANTNCTFRTSNCDGIGTKAGKIGKEQRVEN